MRSIAILVVALLLALSACSSGDGGSGSSVTSTQAASSTTAATTSATSTTVASTTTAVETTTTTSPPVAAEIVVTSPAYEEGGTIPVVYTCDGDDVSPPYELAGVPAEAASLVVVMDDPDAPVGVWDHWVVYDVVPTDAIAEAVEDLGTDGINSWGELGYGGPCPPAGPAHRYILRVLALNVVLDWSEGVDKDGLLETVAPFVIAEGQLMELYGR